MPHALSRCRLGGVWWSSSLDTRDAERFERDGVEYVRFDLVHSSNGAPLTLEYPVTRDALIRRHGCGPGARDTTRPDCG